MISSEDRWVTSDVSLAGFSLITISIDGGVTLNSIVSTGSSLSISTSGANISSLFGEPEYMCP